MSKMKFSSKQRSEAQITIPCVVSIAKTLTHGLYIVCIECTGLDTNFRCHPAKVRRFSPLHLIMKHHKGDTGFDTTLQILALIRYTVDAK